LGHAKPTIVIARLAAFAKASPAERICGPGEALAETGQGEPVFPPLPVANREAAAYWITRMRG